MATAFPLPVDVSVWRLPIDRYHAMIRSGILTAEDQIELLEGVLVEKMSKSPAHSCCVTMVALELNRILPAAWHHRNQEPVTLLDSEPEPDSLVVRGDPKDFARRHPGPADVALVIEVADSSLTRDRGAKKRIYARAGIPNYWLIDLTARTLEVYTRPQGEDYAAKAILREGDSVTVELENSPLPAIAVANLLPPA
jgi:Uma2 family endonuclease